MPPTRSRFFPYRVRTQLTADLTTLFKRVFLLFGALLRNDHFFHPSKQNGLNSKARINAYNKKSEIGWPQSFL